MGKEFFEMQQEASRRLREMQRRAAVTPGGEDPPKQKPPRPMPEPPQTGGRGRLSSLLGALDFRKLTKDGDGLILLVLLLLLTQEETDELLILALLYVML